MTRPIDGQLSLMQLPQILEMIQTAQREAAVNQLKQESDTEKAKDTYETSVTRNEEVEGRTIRDEDPRRGRERRRRPDKAPGRDQHDQALQVDILV